MPLSYSNDLRGRVINCLKQGNSQSYVSHTFSISIRSVKRWWKKYNETGSYEPYERVFDLSKLRILDYEKVANFVAKHPDFSLKEIGKEFKTSDSAIFYVLRKLNITYKKTLPIRGAKGRFARRISKDLKRNSQRKTDLS